LQEPAHDTGGMPPWRRLLSVAAWPLFCLLGAALLWVLTEARLADEREEALADARNRAVSIAGAYAEQMARTIDEIDRATLLISRLWLESDGRIDLDGYFEHGVFPDNHFHASVGDPDGNVIASTLPIATPLKFADRPWYQAHRTDRHLGLLVSPPEKGPRTGRTIVRFSRRIESAGGHFAGVAWVTVEPPYLTAFYGGQQLKADEFVSLRLHAGPVLVTRVGGMEVAPRIFYRQHPVFPTVEGVATEAGERFVDGAARVVGWRRLDRYPLVALAALKLDNVLAPWAASARSWRAAAAIGTLLLLALAAVGASYSWRLAQRKQQARDARDTYRLAVDAAQEGFYMLAPIRDHHGFILGFRVEDCNERAAELLGLTRHKVLAHSFSAVLPPELRDDTDRLLRRAMETGFQEEEYRVPGQRTGRPTWLYRRFMRARSGIAMVVRDISHLKAHEQELVQLVNTDPLTGLPNRHWLHSFLPLALERATNASARLALLFIDLDDFKNINDTLGHDAGDELLRTVAQRLRAAIRGSDHAVRLGGDEFTVVAEHIDRTEDVAQVAGTIVRTLSEPFTLKSIPNQRIRASVGISIFPDDGGDEATLIKHADIAMYAAKAAGKGRFHFYQPQLSDTLILRLSKEEALRRAVEHDEFFVQFQPRIGVASGRLTSMEALVRWRHPERGIVYPGEFIDIAEDTGLIVRLGQLVIDKACAQLAAWRQQGLTPVPVSINVSAHQLRHGEVSSYLADCLRRHDVSPALLEVELTETAVVDASPVVARELRDLRALGVKLMIDDFGTGHSSLAQLQRLDVDVLKVDKAFTDALSAGSEGRILFQAIVSMADALDMCVVAEGVETDEQFRLLEELHCDEVQGHLVSHAVAGEDMPRLMRQASLRPLAARPA